TELQLLHLPYTTLFRSCIACGRTANGIATMPSVLISVQFPSLSKSISVPSLSFASCIVPSFDGDILSSVFVIPASGKCVAIKLFAPSGKPAGVLDEADEGKGSVVGLLFVFCPCLFS